MTVWKLRKALSRRLLVWSTFSMSAGIVLILAGTSFWRAFGVQSVAWGAIDAAIALLGWWTYRRRLTSQRGEPAVGEIQREERSLRRLLWINTALDVLYVAGGLGLALVLGTRGAHWQGHGWGIVVQGGFLFFFDLIHAQSVPVTIQTEVPAGLREPEHLPFLWEAGKPAALLVHGFLGTPLEMRPLGELLRQAGWTVHGPLLPGFGSQIDTLERRRHEDWLSAVQDALEALRRGHGPVLLIGYSMGAALAVSAAASDPPDGLVLLAPFWELGSRLQRGIGAVLGPFLPRYIRPLRRVDLTDELRHAIAKYMPGIDLEDPETRQQIRDLAIPVSLLAQVNKAGQDAYRHAGSVKPRTLIVQGQRDQVVDPRSTDRLVRRLRCEHQYEVVDADHELTDADREGWAAVRQVVLGFAESLLGSQA